MRRRGDRGASALEMSIVVPVFLLLVFAIVEAALWLFARNVATLAAREGATVLRISGTLDDTADFREVAEQQAELYAGQLGALETVEAVAGPQVDGRITMTVTGTYTDLVPFFESTVESSITVEVEQFEPDTGEAG